MQSLGCSQQALSSLGKRRCRSHHSPRLLHDEVGKASSLPVPDLWKDVLLDSRDTLRNMKGRPSLW